MALLHDSHIIGNLTIDNSLSIFTNDIVVLRMSGDGYGEQIQNPSIMLGYHHLPLTITSSKIILKNFIDEDDDEIECAYGRTLPSTGTEGQLFFRLVE